MVTCPIDTRAVLPECMAGEEPLYCTAGDRDRVWQRVSEFALDNTAQIVLTLLRGVGQIHARVQSCRKATRQVCNCQENAPTAHRGFWEEVDQIQKSVICWKQKSLFQKHCMETSAMVQDVRY